MKDASSATGEDVFDFVIVGAGSAGCVLANRLSEDPANRVCLLEAGPEDRNIWIGVPLGISVLFDHPTLNWRFSSVPQIHAGGRSIYTPRGKVLGGSSSINGMVYLRGDRGDYDDWAVAGNTGWGYADVLPYFLRSENNETWRCSPYHGIDGPLDVTAMREHNPSCESFIEAAQLLQIPRCADFNAPEPVGVGYRQVTQRHGRRASASTAFLQPVRARANLTVITGVTADRVLFDGRRATAVRVVAQCGARDLVAQREVILCAGAIGSPHLLQRSGVGDPEHLRAMGVEVVHELPGVGGNLQDHNLVSAAHKTRSRTPYGLSLAALPQIAWDVVRYLVTRRGMFASNGSEAAALVKTDPGMARPDIQLSFVSGRRAASIRNQSVGHGFGVTAIQLRPWSRGSVRMTSPDPHAPPAIDFQMFADNRDLEILVEGLRIARRVLAAPPFQRYGVIEQVPPASLVADEHLRDFVRNNSGTSFHPIGSCAMGTGEGAVVDARLKVRGIDALRVVDASVAPSLVGGAINAAVIMIGEKGADLILGRPPPASIDLSRAA